MVCKYRSSPDNTVESLHGNGNDGQHRASQADLGQGEHPWHQHWVHLETILNTSIEYFWNMKPGVCRRG